MIRMKPKTEVMNGSNTIIGSRIAIQTSDPGKIDQTITWNMFLNDRGVRSIFNPIQMQKEAGIHSAMPFRGLLNVRYRKAVYASWNPSGSPSRKAVNPPVYNAISVFPSVFGAERSFSKVSRGLM